MISTIKYAGKPLFHVPEEAWEKQSGSGSEVEDGVKGEIEESEGDTRDGEEQKAVEEAETH